MKAPSNRVHRLRKTLCYVRHTWCGSDPARKGIVVETPGGPPANCPECLLAERRAAPPKGPKPKTP